MTTAHRLLAELTDWGALVRRTDGRYEIGRKLWDLGLLAPVSLELRQVAAPFLLDLHTTIRDTVHLAVREGLPRLRRADLRPRVGARRQPGRQPLPLHATGVGKVLLAAAPGEVVEQALRSLTRLTRNTVVEPGRSAASSPRCAAAGTPGPRRACRRAPSLAVPVQVERRTGRSSSPRWGRRASRRTAGTSRLVPVLEVAARGIGRELARTRDFH